MNYSEYLSENPFLQEFPRQIVIMHSNDGSQKILHVNNQLITGPKLKGPESQLAKAINNYFESHNETLRAEIFTQKNKGQKELIDTIINS